MLRRQILGLLTRGRRHGYALAKEHRVRTCLPSGSGNFYRDLKTLAGLGMVRLPDEKTDPRKVTYEITPSGTSDFYEWMGDVPDAIGWPESELATRAPLLFLLPRETMSPLLDEWKTSLWSAIRRNEDTRLLAKGTAGLDKSIAETLVQRRTKHLTLELEFVEELRAAFEAHPEDAADPAERSTEEAPVNLDARGGRRR